MGAGLGAVHALHPVNCGRLLCVSQKSKLAACVLQGWAYYWGTSEWSREQLEEVRGRREGPADQLEFEESLQESHVRPCWVVGPDACKAAQLC